MMGKMTEWLEMDDGHEIYLRSWVNEGESPKAIVQISHGMAEHIARYDDFAQFLLNRGILFMEMIIAVMDIQVKKPFLVILLKRMDLTG